jgi:hypothetical protein
MEQKTFSFSVNFLVALSLNFSLDCRSLSRFEHMENVLLSVFRSTSALVWFKLK